MFKILIIILSLLIGFLLGILVTNSAWRSKVDDISKRLLEATDEQFKRAYEKDNIIRRDNHEN